MIRAGQAIAEALGCPGASFTITMPYICDNCQREDVEAFPYDVYDREGKHWEDLCNDCFEALGCEVEAYWEEDQP